MAARTPLVRSAGQVRQLPAGDALKLPGPLNDPATQILTAADNLDISGTTSTLLRLDAAGSVTINGFGSSSDGMRRIIKFNSNTITLVYQNGVLNLPSNANITPSQGDFAEFVCEGGGSWRCLWYQKVNGKPLVGNSTNDFTTAEKTIVDSLTATGNTALTAAATLNIGAATTETITVSGNTTITAFDTAPAGTTRILRGSGAGSLRKLTYNATSMILPGSIDFRLTAGTSITMVSLGSGNWACTSYANVDGTAQAYYGGTLTTPLNETVITSLASAATTDLSTSGSNTVSITGSATITSLGTMASGARRILQLAVGIVLTNSSNIVLPGGANITTTAGDAAEFVSQGSGVWVCLWYSRGGFEIQAALALKLPYTGGTLTGVLNYAATQTMASATFDIGAGATSNEIFVTGNTALTALGTDVAGATRRLVFQSVLVLTHNATSLILPTQANISTATNDVAEFRSLGSGNWLCTSYSRANGTALVGLTNPMTTTGDLIKGGSAGAAARLAIGSTGQTLAVSGGAPVWSSGAGIAALIASGTDYPFYNGMSNGAFSPATVNSATRTQFHLVHLDSVLTFDHMVLCIRTTSAAQSMDIGIYNFLGAGKPGTCVASANFSTTSSGRISVSTGAFTLPPGLYYVAWHATTTTPTCVSLSQTSGFYLSALAAVSISDAMTQLGAGTTTLAAVLFNDASLPGGSYTRGMDMTGLTLSSGNIVGYNTSVPVVGLTKQ